MKRETFKMVHPVHGSAQCSEEQFAEFEALGWVRELAPAVAAPVAPVAPVRGRKGK